MYGLHADIYHPVGHFEGNFGKHSLLEALHKGELHELEDTRDNHPEEHQNRQNDQRLKEDTGSHDVYQCLGCERNSECRQTSHHGVGNQDDHVPPLLPHQVKKALNSRWVRVVLGCVFVVLTHRWFPTGSSKRDRCRIQGKESLLVFELDVNEAAKCLSGCTFALVDEKEC